MASDQIDKYWIKATVEMQGSDTLCTQRLLAPGEANIIPSQHPLAQGSASSTSSNAPISNRIISNNISAFSLEPSISTFGNVTAISESYLAYSSKALNKDQAFVRVFNTKSNVASRTLLAGHVRVVDIAFASLPSPPAGRKSNDADALPDFTTHFAPLALYTGNADKKTHTVPRTLLAATDFYGDLFLYELLEFSKPKSIQDIFILRVRHRDSAPLAPMPVENETDSSPEQYSSVSSLRSGQSSASLVSAPGGKLSPLANRRVVWSKMTSAPSAPAEGSLAESGLEESAYSDVVRYSLILAHTDGAKCDVWDIHSLLRDKRAQLLASANELLPAQCKLAQEQDKNSNASRPPPKALLDLKYSSVPLPSAIGEPLHVVRLSHHSDAITTAVFSPEGQLLATAALDGYVRYVNGPVFPNYFLASPSDLDPTRAHEASVVHSKPPRQPLFSWQPHDGLPVHTLIFLEDFPKLVSREVEVVWRYAITGTYYNHELKLWKTQGWKCIQLLRFTEPEALDLSVSDPRTIIRVAVDNSAQLLVLSDMRRRVYYVAQIARRARADTPAHSSGNADAERGSGSPGAAAAAAAGEQTVPPEEASPAEADEELWLATLSEFVLRDPPLAFSISTIKRTSENVNDLLNDGYDVEESEDQIELYLYACMPKFLQSHKITFSLPANPTPPAYLKRSSLSATNGEDPLQNLPTPDNSAMEAATSDLMGPQDSLMLSGAKLEHTPESASKENKPILLNPGDFLDASEGGLGSVPPPAPLADRSLWGVDQSFEPSAEPVSFVGPTQTASQLQAFNESGPLAFGRLDSSTSSASGQAAVEQFMGQTQSTESVGAPIGFRSTVLGVGSAFHPYNSPGKRLHDAEALSSLVPVSQPSVSTSLSPASFISLPQTVVSGLKPSPYLSSTGLLELVQSQPPQLMPPRLPDTSSADNALSGSTTNVTAATTTTTTSPLAAVAAVPPTIATASGGTGTPLATTTTTTSSYPLNTSIAPSMLPTSVIRNVIAIKPAKAKAPSKTAKKKSNAADTPSKETGTGPNAGPDELKTTTKTARTPALSGSSDVPESSSILEKMSTRLERALQLLEAQQGQIGRLEQEVGSLRTALASASSSAQVEPRGLPNGAGAPASVVAQASLLLQLDAHFDHLKNLLDKGLKQNESALDAMARSNQSMMDRMRTNILASMQSAILQQRTSGAPGTAIANAAPSPDAVASAVSKALEKTLQSRLLDAFKVELQNFQNSLMRNLQAVLNENIRREIASALASKETCDMLGKSIQDPIVKSVTEVHSRHLFPVVQGAVDSILAKLAPRFEEGFKEHGRAIREATIQLPQLLNTAVRDAGREAMEHTATEVMTREMQRMETALGDAIKAQMQPLLEQVIRVQQLQQQQQQKGSGAGGPSTAELEARLKEQLATALLPLQALPRQLSDLLVNQLGNQLAISLYNALSTPLSQTVSKGLQSYAAYVIADVKTREEALTNAYKGHVDTVLRAQLQKPLESLGPDLQRQLVANNEALKTEMEALFAGFTPVLTKQVHESILPRLQEALSQAVVPVLNECVQRAVRAALPPSGQLTPRPPSVMGARSSSPSRPAIDRDELLQNIRAGRVNHAFQVALYASDLPLVEWLCLQAYQLANNRVELVLSGFQLPGRAESSGPLDFTIILSLAQQLAMSLTTSQFKPSTLELKLSYLQAAMNVLMESHSPTARQHTPSVIKLILQQCTLLQQSLNAPVATSSPGNASAAPASSSLPPNVARLLRQVVMLARGALEELNAGPLSPTGVPSTNSSLVVTSGTLFS